MATVLEQIKQAAIDKRTSLNLSGNDDARPSARCTTTWSNSPAKRESTKNTAMNEGSQPASFAGQRPSHLPSPGHRPGSQGDNSQRANGPAIWDKQRVVTPCRHRTLHGCQSRWHWALGKGHPDRGGSIDKSFLKPIEARPLRHARRSNGIFVPGTGRSIAGDQCPVDAGLWPGNRERRHHRWRH